MANKGYKKELELVHMLWDAGFAVVRTPASGSVSKKPLPDMIAGNGRKYIAVEAKATKSDYIYLDEDEVKNLKEFSRIFGAEPLIGARFDHMKWAFFNPDSLSQTQRGAYKINRKLAEEKGLRFEDIVRCD